MKSKVWQRNKNKRQYLWVKLEGTAHTVSDNISMANLKCLDHQKKVNTNVILRGPTTGFFFNIYFWRYNNFMTISIWLTDIMNVSIYQNVHAGFLLTGLRSVEIPEDGISIDFSSTKKSLLLPKASLYPSSLFKEITRVGAPTLRKWWSEQDSLKQCHLHNYDYVI